jgi:hypothetical protein
LIYNTNTNNQIDDINIKNKMDKIDDDINIKNKMDKIDDDLIIEI